MDDTPHPLRRASDTLMLELRDGVRDLQARLLAHLEQEEKTQAQQQTILDRHEALLIGGERTRGLRQRVDELERDQNETACRVAKLEREWTGSSEAPGQSETNRRVLDWIRKQEDREKELADRDERVRAVLEWAESRRAAERLAVRWAVGAIITALALLLLSHPDVVRGAFGG